MAEFINDICESCANGSFDTCDATYEQVTLDAVTRNVVDCDCYSKKTKHKLKITYECEDMIATEVREVYDLPNVKWKRTTISNEEIAEIVKYLNEKTKKNYRASSGKTRDAIKARFQDDFTVDDFKKVIDNKVVSWGKDPKMAQFLRPSTLFGTKFEEYLNETPVKSPDKLHSKPSYDLEEIKRRAMNNTEI